MDRSTSRRLGALLCGATLLASLIIATLASPAAAAKPKCQGQTATIVGTARGERIVGTAGRDVIVAKGGHDTIYGRGGNDLVCAGSGNDTVHGGPGADTVWGQLGNDRLFGSAGPDFLAGQVGDDTLNGGLHVDKCYQGTGTGPVVNCELPPPAAVAPPPPSGPTLIPMTGILAVAFSDIDGLDGYSTGDALIARLMDTSGNTLPGPGDTVEMGRYPTNLEGTAFGDWTANSHMVTSAGSYSDHVVTFVGADQFTWYRTASAESYQELGSPFGLSYVVDNTASHEDAMEIYASSPSTPQTEVPYKGLTRYSDDRFIDVVLDYPVP